MRILFPYPREFGYFPDLYEYVTLLRARGLDAFYVGIQQDQALDLPSYIIRHPDKDVQRQEFVRFAAEQIAAIQPDIVHTFHFRGCGALPLLARRSAKKWLVDVRTIHVETRDLKISSDFWLRDRLTWLETQTYDYILALTNTIHKKLRPSIRPVEIVPLGASFTKLNSTARSCLRAKLRNELAVSLDDPVILYAGSLSPTRHLDRIISGFAGALDSFPMAKLLIVGGSLKHGLATDPLIASLLDLTRRLGISRSVLFTGRVPYSDMPMYMAGSDIGISYMPLGTPHQYQPPTKLIEYMMAGIVAAGNRIPANEGIIEDNLSGIIFGDLEAEIAEGMRRALTLLSPEYQDLRLNLTANARNAVRDRDWQRIVDERLIPIYEKLSKER